MSRLPRSLGVLLLALGLAASTASGAPPTAHRIPIQGAALDAADQPIASGGVAVRIYTDSLGGSPVYDSGTQFAGAIANGIFDIVAGQATPLTLDQERSYFMELDVAGVEVVGDAAGARWKFFPGGGSHARTDLEARIDALETIMGLPAPQLREATMTRVASPARANATFTDLHGLLGIGFASGSQGVYSATAHLITQPVGLRTANGVQARLGPCYLYTPSPNPTIRSVQDVPGDQGRAVRIRWRNDQRERPHDAADTQPRVTGYTVYRRVGPGQAALMRAKPGLTRVLALPDGDWDVLTSVPATLDSTYQTVVPTLCDSNATGTCRSVFVVRSITDQVGIYHNSFADSGYSVDNLAPGVPVGFVAQAVVGGNSLSWQPSTAQDFQFFRVYRSTDPGFLPGPATLVQTTATTTWTDPQTGSFTYKLTAVDANGNESPPASASIAVGVEKRAPTALALASLHPNPFNQSLTIAVEIPEACGRVELSLFDLAGRKVRTLVSHALPAGRYSFTWDGRGSDRSRLAPGIYVARLVGSGRTFTRRATLLP